MLEEQELGAPCVACSFVQWRPPDDVTALRRVF